MKAPNAGAGVTRSWARLGLLASIAVVAVSVGGVGSASAVTHSNQPDPNFAGYLASHTHDATPVTATFVVPTLNCSGTTADLDVFPGDDLRTKGGVTATLAGIDLNCNGGVATYTAQAEFNSTVTSLSMTISPGDTVVATVAATSAASSGQIQDVTTGVTQSATFTGFVPNGGAKAGVFSTTGGSGELGVPPFGKIAFTHVKVGGAPIGSFPVTGFDRTNGATVQIKATALSGGTAFKAVFKHS